MTTTQATPPGGKATGHPKAFWFIFWGELAERASYYGMRAILTLYMVDKLGFSDSNASATMSYFIAGCYFLPLLGGFIADHYLGKYWTIVAFSLPYIIGHVVLGIENVPCLFAALALLAMGSGVIKPNISPLMGMTYDQQRPGQEKLLSHAFAIFYGSINIGAAASSLAMPWIRTHYGYSIAFLFPAALMVVAFAVFASGKGHYAKETISRKPKTLEEREAQRLVLRRLGAIFLLVSFFWSIFDQSASTWVLFARDYLNLYVFGIRLTADSMQSVNPILIILLLGPLTLLWDWLARHGLRLRATDKMMIGFGLTTICMATICVAAFLTTKKSAIVRDKGTVHPQTVERALYRLPEVQDAFVMQVPTTSMFVRARAIVGVAPGKELTESAVQEHLEKTIAAEERPDEVEIVNGPVVDPEKASILWQVVAYVLMTVAEICISVVGLELAYTAAPKSVKSFVTAVWLLTVFFGNMATAQIAKLYGVLSPESYFGVLAAMMAAASVAFFFVARWFNRASIQWAAEEG